MSDFTFNSKRCRYYYGLHYDKNRYIGNDDDLLDLYHKCRKLVLWVDDEMKKEKKYKKKDKLDNLNMHNLYKEKLNNFKHDIIPYEQELKNMIKKSAIIKSSARDPEKYLNKYSEHFPRAVIYTLFFIKDIRKLLKKLINMTG